MLSLASTNSLLHSSYFINHYTKTTSWEDPRVRYQQIGKSSSTAGGSAKDANVGGASTQKAVGTSSIGGGGGEQQGSSSQSDQQPTTLVSHVSYPMCTQLKWVL